MHLGEPTQVVTPTLDGPVLAVLARAGEELTPSQVHERCRRGSEAGVRRVLARLAEQGVVTTRPAATAHVYGLNRQHLAARHIEALVELRGELWARLREELAGWQVAAVYAGVFGSAARGDADEASDVDLLLVRPDRVPPDHPRWEAQVSRLTRLVSEWTGNRLQVLDLARADLARATRSGERLVRELRRDAVDLVGSLAPVLASPRARRPR